MSDSKSDVGAVRHTFVVDAVQAGERLDRFLAAQPSMVEAAVSRTRVKALIEAAQVHVDDLPVLEAGAKLAAGAHVRLALPPAIDATPVAEAIPLSVIFEDDQLIVIDKPAGLVVHPAAGNETGTLVNALLAHCGDSLSGIGGVRRPGIVHRLDKDTSGLLVAAKTDAAHRALSALFADHGRTKPFVREYRALVWGAPSRAAGTVDLPLGRHGQHREKMAVVTPEKGREAITHWRLDAAFGTPPVAAEIVCRLETGPHASDPRASGAWRPSRARRPAVRRGVSHEGRSPGRACAACPVDARPAGAARGPARLPHPVTGEQLDFVSALPPDLQALRDALAA